MLTPSQIGGRAEAAVLAALALSGRTVFLPFGGHYRYDLLFEEGDRFFRVQCKSEVLKAGAVSFNTCSWTNNVPQDYRDQIDFFGVYCHALTEAYLVPVSVVGQRVGHLRVEPTRNNQVKKLRWAKDFLLQPVVDETSLPYY